MDWSASGSRWPALARRSRFVFRIVCATSGPLNQNKFVAQESFVRLGGNLPHNSSGFLVLLLGFGFVFVFGGASADLFPFPLFCLSGMGWACFLFRLLVTSPRPVGQANGQRHVFQPASERAGEQINCTEHLIARRPRVGCSAGRLPASGRACKCARARRRKLARTVGRRASELLVSWLPAGPIDAGLGGRAWICCCCCCCCSID